MSSIDLSTMYKFLAKYGADNAWAQHADSNADSKITYGEFKGFVLDNQDEIEVDNKTSVMDLINQFWTKFDNDLRGKIGNSDVNDKYALNEEEMNNIEQKIEREVIRNEFIQEYVQFPSQLTGNHENWRRDILAAIDGLIESSNVSNEELAQFLQDNYPAIEREVTAEYIKTQYFDSLRQGVLYGLNYDINGDETLQMLINNYLARLDENATLDNINEGIKAIIDAYLSTAGLGQGANGNLGIGGAQDPMMVLLESLGYNPNILNDLQIAVLARDIEGELKDKYNYPPALENKFNDVIQDFIDDQLRNRNINFNNIDIEDIIEEFENSDYKIRLDECVEFLDAYSDIVATNSPIPFNGTISGNLFVGNILTSADKKLGIDTSGGTLSLNANITPGNVSDIIVNQKDDITATSPTTDPTDIYSYLRNEFGVYIANQIANNDSDGPYQDIIDEILDKICNDIWTIPESADAINEYITKQIFLNLQDIIGSSAQEIKIDKLNGLFENFRYDDLETRKEAAIQYCEILWSKGEKYQAIVENILGSNWADSINNATDLNTLMNKLKRAAKTVEEYENFEIKFAGDGESTVNNGLNTGDSMTLSLKNVHNNVTYQVSCTGSGSANVDNNTLTITAGDKTGPMTVTIQAFVDGVCIGTRELTINVKGVEQTPGTGNVGGADGATGATGRTDIENSETLQKYSSGFIFTGFYRDWDDAKEELEDQIEVLTNDIAGELVEEGFAREKVKNALTCTQNYFIAFITKLKDIYSCVTKDHDMESAEFSYFDHNGNILYGTTSGRYITGSDEKTIEEDADSHFNSNANTNLCILIDQDFCQQDEAIKIRKSFITNIFKGFMK